MLLQPLTFATVSGCDQFVLDSTHALGRTLMTDVPDILWVAAVAPRGNFDHSSKSTDISMAEAVPNLCLFGFFSETPS